MSAPAAVVQYVPAGWARFRPLAGLTLASTVDDVCASLETALGYESGTMEVPWLLGTADTKPASAEGGLELSDTGRTLGELRNGAPGVRFWLRVVAPPPTAAPPPPAAAPPPAAGGAGAPLPPAGGAGASASVVAATASGTHGPPPSPPATSFVAWAGGASTSPAASAPGSALPATLGAGAGALDTRAVLDACERAALDELRKPVERLLRVTYLATYGAAREHEEAMLDTARHLRAEDKNSEAQACMVKFAAESVRVGGWLWLPYTLACLWDNTETTFFVPDVDLLAGPASGTAVGPPSSAFSPPSRDRRIWLRARRSTQAAWERCTDEPSARDLEGVAHVDTERITDLEPAVWLLALQRMPEHPPATAERGDRSAGRSRLRTYVDRVPPELSSDPKFPPGAGSHGQALYSLASDLRSLKHHLRHRRDLLSTPSTVCDVARLLAMSASLLYGIQQQWRRWEVKPPRMREWDTGTPGRPLAVEAAACRGAAAEVDAHLTEVVKRLDHLLSGGAARSLPPLTIAQRDDLGCVLGESRAMEPTPPLRLLVALPTADASNAMAVAGWDVLIDLHPLLQQEATGFTLRKPARTSAGGPARMTPVRSVAAQVLMDYAASLPHVTVITADTRDAASAVRYAISTGGRVVVAPFATAAAAAAIRPLYGAPGPAPAERKVVTQLLRDVADALTGFAHSASVTITLALLAMAPYSLPIRTVEAAWVFSASGGIAADGTHAAATTFDHDCAPLSRLLVDKLGDDLTGGAVWTLTDNATASPDMYQWLVGDTSATVAVCRVDMPSVELRSQLYGRFAGSNSAGSGIFVPGNEQAELLRHPDSAGSLLDLASRSLALLSDIATCGVTLLHRDTPREEAKGPLPLTLPGAPSAVPFESWLRAAAVSFALGHEPAWGLLDSSFRVDCDVEAVVMERHVDVRKGVESAIARACSVADSGGVTAVVVTHAPRNGATTLLRQVLWGYHTHSSAARCVLVLSPSVRVADLRRPELARALPAVFASGGRTSVLVLAERETPSEAVAEFVALCQRLAINAVVVCARHATGPAWTFGAGVTVHPVDLPPPMPKEMEQVKRAYSNLRRTVDGTPVDRHVDLVSEARKPTFKRMAGFLSFAGLAMGSEMQAAVDGQVRLFAQTAVREGFRHARADPHHGPQRRGVLRALAYLALLRETAPPQCHDVPISSVMALAQSAAEQGKLFEGARAAEAVLTQLAADDVVRLCALPTPQDTSDALALRDIVAATMIWPPRDGAPTAADVLFPPPHLPQAGRAADRLRMLATEYLERCCEEVVAMAAPRSHVTVAADLRTASKFPADDVGSLVTFSTLPGGGLSLWDELVVRSQSNVQGLPAVRFAHCFASEYLRAFLAEEAMDSGLTPPPSLSCGVAALTTCLLAHADVARRTRGFPPVAYEPGDAEPPLVHCLRHALTSEDGGKRMGRVPVYELPEVADQDVSHFGRLTCTRLLAACMQPDAAVELPWHAAVESRRITPEDHGACLSRGLHLSMLAYNVLVRSAGIRVELARLLLNAAGAADDLTFHAARSGRGAAVAGVPEDVLSRLVLQAAVATKCVEHILLRGRDSSPTGAMLDICGNVNHFFAASLGRALQVRLQRCPDGAPLSVPDLLRDELSGVLDVVQLACGLFRSQTQARNRHYAACNEIRLWVTLWNSTEYVCKDAARHAGLDRGAWRRLIPASLRIEDTLRQRLVPLVDELTRLLLTPDGVKADKDVERSRDVALKRVSDGFKTWLSVDEYAVTHPVRLLRGLWEKQTAQHVSGDEPAAQLTRAQYVAACMHLWSRQDGNTSMRTLLLALHERQDTDEVERLWACQRKRMVVSADTEAANQQTFMLAPFIADAPPAAGTSPSAADLRSLLDWSHGWQVAAGDTHSSALITQAMIATQMMLAGTARPVEAALVAGLLGRWSAERSEWTDGDLAKQLAAAPSARYHTLGLRLTGSLADRLAWRPQLLESQEDDNMQSPSVPWLRPVSVSGVVVRAPQGPTRGVALIDRVETPDPLRVGAWQDLGEHHRFAITWPRQQFNEHREPRLGQRVQGFLTAMPAHDDRAFYLCIKHVVAVGNEEPPLPRPAPLPTEHVRVQLAALDLGTAVKAPGHVDRGYGASAHHGVGARAAASWSGGGAHRVSPAAAAPAATASASTGVPPSGGAGSGTSVGAAPAALPTAGGGKAAAWAAGGAGGGTPAAAPAALPTAGGGRATAWAAGGAGGGTPAAAPAALPTAGGGRATAWAAGGAGGGTPAAAPAALPTAGGGKAAAWAAGGAGGGTSVGAAPAALPTAGGGKAAAWAAGGAGGGTPAAAPAALPTAGGGRVTAWAAGGAVGGTPAAAPAALPTAGGGKVAAWAAGGAGGGTQAAAAAPATHSKSTYATAARSGGTAWAPAPAPGPFTSTAALATGGGGAADEGTWEVVGGQKKPAPAPPPAPAGRRWGPGRGGGGGGRGGTHRGGKW
jgi:hypothetical protein